MPTAKRRRSERARAIARGVRASIVRQKQLAVQRALEGPPPPIVWPTPAVDARVPGTITITFGSLIIGIARDEAGNTRIACAVVNRADGITIAK